MDIRARQLQILIQDARSFQYVVSSRISDLNKVNSVFDHALKSAKQRNKKVQSIQSYFCFRDENDILEEQTIDEFVEKSIALLKQR